MSRDLNDTSNIAPGPFAYGKYKKGAETREIWTRRAPNTQYVLTTRYSGVEQTQIFAPTAWVNALAAHSDVIAAWEAAGFVKQ